MYKQPLRIIIILWVKYNTFRLIYACYGLWYVEYLPAKSYTFRLYLAFWTVKKKRMIIKLLNKNFWKKKWKRTIKRMQYKVSDQWTSCLSVSRTYYHVIQGEFLWTIKAWYDNIYLYPFHVHWKYFYFNGFLHITEDLFAFYIPPT